VAQNHVELNFKCKSNSYGVLSTLKSVCLSVKTTPFILSSVGNDTLSVFLILLSVI
jgi:hypothetical protein